MFCVELYTDSVFLVSIQSVFLSIYRTDTGGKLGQYVGLSVAIAREQSEAFYLGNVFFTYGTECPIKIWREAPDYIRATRFSGEQESG